MVQRYFLPILQFIHKPGLISISILLFYSTGITLPRSDASLPCSFAPQGLFRPTGCIPVFLFFTTGITLPRSDASLSSSFSPQGLFRPVRCIPPPLFFTTGIISAGQISPIAESISARPFRHLHIVPRQNNCTGRQFPTTD